MGNCYTLFYCKVCDLWHEDENIISVMVHRAENIEKLYELAKKGIHFKEMRNYFCRNCGEYILTDLKKKCGCREPFPQSADGIHHVLYDLENGDSIVFCPEFNEFREAESRLHLNGLDLMCEGCGRLLE